MLSVPFENADKQQLTATLNLQPALEALFTSTVDPGAFDAILLGTRDGRVLVSAGSGAEQLRLSGLDVLSTKETEASKPVKFRELSEAITMAEVRSAASTTRFSSLHVACKRKHRRIDSSWQGWCAATRCARAAGRFRPRS